MATVLAAGMKSLVPHPQNYEAILERAKKALESRQEVKVDVCHIRPNPDQPRKHFDPVELQLLSESIDSAGQIVGGILRPTRNKGDYVIVDGERRWRAICIIPAERRPLYKADAIDADDDVVQFLISGMANFNRVGHNVLETLATIRYYHEKMKIPLRQIASLIGMRETKAGQIYSLRNLHPDALKLLDASLPERERLPTSAAIQISKMEGAQHLHLELARRVLTREVSLANLRAEVVSVAKSAGVPVTTKKLDPRKRWAKVLLNVQNLSGLTGRIETLLADPDMRRFLESRKAETAASVKHLAKAAGSLAEIEKAFKPPEA
jgi:ParB/RepB/Spo0J family partition protein